VVAAVVAESEELPHPASKDATIVVARTILNTLFFMFGFPPF
jgi:hypothetical protein